MSESVPPQGHVNLQAVADIVGGRVTGDPSVVVDGVAPVDQAGPSELGFLASQRYVRFVAASQAGALLAHAPLVERLPEQSSPRSMVIVDDPHVALRLLLGHLYPEVERPHGIHPTAVIGADVVMGRGCSIGPYAVVEDGGQIGSDVSIGAHVVVGAGCVVGKQSVLHPHVVLYPGVRVGMDVIIHSGARIGVDGFGYVYEDGAHQKVPQVGRCVIEDHVEIGANTCIDRGSIGSTRIGAGTKIDNQVHIAHNVDVGEKSLLIAQVGIAGSSRVGKGAQLGGQVGVSGHLSVGDGARLGAQAGVIGDVPAGATFWGTPARPRTETLRRLANMGKVQELARRIKALEEAGNTGPNTE